MRRSPAAWACMRCARSSTICRSANSTRTPTRSSATGSMRSPNGSKQLITEIEKQLTKKLADRGIAARGHRAAQARLFDLAQDGAQVGRLRAAFRHFRLPCRRQDAGRLLSGARHRAHDLAGRAGTLQGLHLDAEAERLSLDPYDGDRARQAARRTANPHHRDARDRRIRHRRARALQGRRRLADRNAVARIRAPMPGCAARSNCWPKGRTRKNSSSTPSSNCSTIRCSASRRRAS